MLGKASPAAQGCPRCHGVVLEVVSTGASLVEVGSLLITARHQQTDAVGTLGRIPWVKTMRIFTGKNGRTWQNMFKTNQRKTHTDLFIYIIYIYIYS